MRFDRMVFVARMLLGVFYLISGMNWFFGYMPMLPHLHMPLDIPMKHPVILEMVKTGWMFQFAKITEVVVGLSLVTNRGIPFMLVFAAPVAFITFMLDAFILDDIWRWLLGSETTHAMLAAVSDMIIGGLCVLLIHMWLMLCYFDHYRPMIVWKATPKEIGE